MKHPAFKAYRFPPCPTPDLEEMQAALAETVRFDMSKKRIQRMSFSKSGNEDGDIRTNFVEGLMADGPSMAFTAQFDSCLALPSSQLESLMREWEKNVWIPQHKVAASASAKSERARAFHAEHFAKVQKEAPGEIQSVGVTMVIDFHHGLLLVEGSGARATAGAMAAERLLVGVGITPKGGDLFTEVELPGILATVRRWILDGAPEGWDLGRYCTLVGEEKDRVSYVNHDMDLEALSKYLSSEGMSVRDAEVIKVSRHQHGGLPVNVSAVVSKGGAISRFTITNEGGVELHGLAATVTWAEELISALDEVCDGVPAEAEEAHA